MGKGIFDASQPVSAWSFWPLAGYADGALPVAPAVSGRDTGFYRLNLSPSDTDRRGQSLDPSQKKFNNRLVGPTSRDEKALDSNRGPFSLARKHLRLPSRFNEIHRIGGFVRGVSLFTGSAFVFCFRSCRYPPDGNERAIKVMLQDQRGTHARS